MRFQVLLLLLVIIAGCGSKNATQSKVVNAVEVTSRDTDASDIIYSSKLFSEKRNRSTSLGDAWSPRKYEQEKYCFTGDIKKTNGLSKIIYQIDSKYYSNEGLLIYRIAAYRIQSVTELVNIKPEPLNIQRLGREKFKQLCGYRLVSKVFYGQQGFFEATVTEYKGLAPNDSSFFGTTNSSDVQIVTNGHAEFLPYLTQGRVTFRTGFSGGNRAQESSRKIEDVANLLVSSADTYSIQDNLLQDQLDLYGVDTAPLY